MRRTCSSGRAGALCAVRIAGAGAFGAVGLLLAVALAAAADATQGADTGAHARAALYEEANAARARIEAGELEGGATRLAALAARLPSLEALADRAHLALHVGRSEVLLGDALGGDARRAARRRAAGLFRRAAEDADAAGAPRLAAYGWGYLGELYLAAERPSEARTATRRALERAGRADAPDATYRFLAQLGRVERAAGEPDAAIEALRSATSSIARLSADLASSSLDAAFAFRSEVEPVYLELVDLLLARARAVGEGDAQALIREARDALETLKTAELRDHFGDDCLAEQRRVAPDDVPGAAVLYPVVLPDRVELIVGREGELSVHRSPVGPEALRDGVRQLRRLVANPITRRYRRAAADLHAALIKPIETRIVGADVLVVVAGGALRTIPFAALYDAEAGVHLVERVAVVSSPGLSLTEPRAFPGPQTPVLAAGLSEARLGFAALPSVTGEVEAIAADFPTTELLNEQLTGERLDAAVASEAVGVIHIASHGEFNADASESFILTWDERLPMDAFAATIARTARRNEAPLELLVLSACETAAGDERAALGLAGIAIQSGARSAVATLWSVNDQATRQLVERFYAELAAGSSRAEALRAAQLELIADETFSHPAFWSPFLLVSSWL